MTSMETKLGTIKHIKRILATESTTPMEIATTRMGLITDLATTLGTEVMGMRNTTPMTKR